MVVLFKKLDSNNILVISSSTKNTTGKITKTDGFWHNPQGRRLEFDGSLAIDISQSTEKEKFEDVIGAIMPLQIGTTLITSWQWLLDDYSHVEETDDERGYFLTDMTDQFIGFNNGITRDELSPDRGCFHKPDARRGIK